MRLAPAEPSLDRLRMALADLREEQRQTATCGLGTGLIQLRAVIDEMEALFAETVDRFHRAQEHLADGSPSTVSWLVSNCHMSAGAAAQRLSVGRQLPDLPETYTALVNGEVGFENAYLMCRTADHVGADAVREQEPNLLPAAKVCAPGRFRQVTSHLEHCIDPDGSLANLLDRHEGRRLRISQSLSGDFYLEGRLDAEGGAMVQTALVALSKPTSDDDRSPWQRRADALVELARRQLDSGDLPLTGGQKPHLILTATRQTLQGLSGSPAADLEWSIVPMPSETARRISCDCAVTEVTLDEKGNPLNVGRTRRTFSGRLRKAVALRDRGCGWPGCGRPPSWCDGHHLKFWINDGETRLDNGLLLCSHHHFLAHEGRWRLIRNDQGEIIAIPPNRFPPPIETPEYTHPPP